MAVDIPILHESPKLTAQGPVSWASFGPALSRWWQKVTSQDPCCVHFPTIPWETQSTESGERSTTGRSAEENKLQIPLLTKEPGTCGPQGTLYPWVCSAFYSGLADSTTKLYRFSAAHPSLPCNGCRAAQARQALLRKTPEHH